MWIVGLNQYGQALYAEEVQTSEKADATIKKLSEDNPSWSFTRQAYRPVWYKDRLDNDEISSI